MDNASHPQFRNTTESGNVCVPLANCSIKDGFLSTTLPITYSLICVVGLASNSLALWVFFCNQRKPTSISVYMKHLAIADLVLSLCLPFRIAYQIGEYSWMQKCYFCKIIGASFYSSMYTSILFLGLISLDRYLKITKPLQQFRIHTVPWSLAVCRAIWGGVLICMLPFVISNHSNSTQAKCFHYKEQNTIVGVMNMVAIVIVYILSLLFLVSYAKISIKLYHISQGKSKQQNRKVSTRAIMKTFIVLIIYMVCFMPYHIVRVPYVLSQINIICSCEWRQTLHIANELVLCLSALNSCLDPIIYLFLSNSFRQTVLHTIQGRLNKTFPKPNPLKYSFKSITEM